MYGMVWYGKVCYVMSCHVMSCHVLFFCIVLYCTVLYCIVLYCIVLYVCYVCIWGVESSVSSDRILQCELTYLELHMITLERYQHCC